MFRAFLVIFLTFAYICILGPPLILYGKLTGNSDPVYKAGVLGAKFCLWLAGVKLEVIGRDKIPQNQSLVFMPNHQSYGDSPIVLPILPPVIALAKKEFFRVPILGSGMRLCKFIPVDRKHRQRAIQSMNEAAERLRRGESFVGFPEGTRSPDGRLQPFKKGVFMMAINAHVPIVPMSISGSHRVMRKDDWAIHPGTVRVTIHDPIPTAGCKMDDRERIMERVRQAVISGLTPEERPL